MTKFEFCALIGRRAKMIEETNNCFANLTKVPKSLQGRLTAEQLTILELIQKKCPLFIQRRLYYNSPYCEVIDPN